MDQCFFKYFTAGKGVPSLGLFRIFVKLPCPYLTTFLTPGIMPAIHLMANSALSVYNLSAFADEGMRLMLHL